jgi:glycosyltransferase involved in cell wall biosynthesis
VTAARVARTDILIVSAGNTSGWRAAATELAESVARAGATVETVTADTSPQVRTFALTDFVQALASRRAAIRGIAEHQPRAIIYCSITAALLWPRPGPISLDSIAAENRPGRHGVWQRLVERRRLSQAPLVLAWSERALAPLRGPRPPVVVVPVPVAGEPSLDGGARDVDAVVYAGDPVKRRLSYVLSEWSHARRPGETLVVTGVDAVQPRDGVRVAGRLPPAEFRALLRRARVFLAAPRREDYGIAALEALVQGCQLVTTPAPGPYPALDLARRLDPRLVTDDLGLAIRTALDDPLSGYAERALQLLAPFTREAVDRTVAGDVLPRLLPGFKPA